MQDKVIKLENPVRIAELNPEGTLKKIGLRDGQTFCDIGAGSGIFTIPAARITSRTVYAVEISAPMLAVISDKARAEGLNHIRPILTEGDRYPIDEHSVDIVLMVTVLHEIERKASLLEEIKRLLKADGTAAVIEFHKRETPMGPPVPRRLGQDEAIGIFKAAGFQPYSAFDLGNNFYCQLFKPVHISQ